MIFDLHNDVLTGEISDGELLDYLNRTLSEGNSAVLALWTSKLSDPLPILKRKIEFISLLKKYLLTCGEKQREADIFFAIEDMFFAAYHNIDEILSLPLLYCGLTWNYENQLAGGAKSEGGLTKLGGHIVDKLNKKNIPIDTAHLGKNSFWSVIERSNRPVINSHTCFSALNVHCRNLDDDQIRAIVDGGGIVGLTAVPEFLTEKGAATPLSVVRHIDYYIEKFGYKSLAIGTDFFGTVHLPKNLNTYKDFSLVRDELKKLGYSSKVIGKIFHGNAASFFKKNEKNEPQNLQQVK